MKILVISDSHGNYPQALKAHTVAGAVDHIVHLGDGADDARLMEEVLEVPVIRVAGNCDQGSGLPQERLLELGGTRLFLTHGNRYQVKSGLELLHRRGVELDAEVVLYGHTHLPCIERRGGVLLVNPGELRSGSGSCAVITVGDREAAAEILPLSAVAPARES